MIHLAQPFHHAYGISAKAAEVVPEILRALERAAGFVARGNPDFRLESYEVMGIDEARALKEAAERTAVTGGKKVFIISARGVTKEAQNALLKICEEPPPETHFFLIVPSFELLLPTLRSRLCEIPYLAAGESKDFSRAEKFLQNAIPDRLKTVQAFLKQREETESNGEILAFLDDLEYCIADSRRLKTQIHADKERTAALAELLTTKKYSRDRAPSWKLLLEHLALVLPKM